MKSIVSVVVIALLSVSLHAQVGGTSSFQFLDLDFNARSLALGGDFIPLKDGDINLAVANPASITKDMDANLALNHFFFPAGINYGMLAYGKHFDKLGTFTGHLRYVSYGQFQRTDEAGVDQGTFTAGDYALGIGYGKTLNKYFSIGGNFNTIFSHYESYTAVGIGVDVATMFYDEESNIAATLVARNIGYQLKGYTKSNNEPLPIEVLAGISYKFHHAPFRLGLIYKDITTWDLTYQDPTLRPTIDQLTQDTIPVPTSSFVQKLAYHTNFSAELVPSDNFHIRLGFNYAQRNGLGIVDRKGLSGFSLGFGLKVKKFAFNYGVAFFSAAGASNVFSVTTDFSKWNRNRKVIQDF
jgi:hypothetical protein